MKAWSLKLTQGRLVFDNNFLLEFSRSLWNEWVVFNTAEAVCRVQHRWNNGISGLCAAQIEQEISEAHLEFQLMLRRAQKSSKR